MPKRKFAPPDSIADILPRLPGESMKAYRAFVDYVMMGAGRDMNALRKRYREMKKAFDEGVPGATLPPSVRTKTITQWSRDFRWEERVEDWERVQAQRDLLAFEQEQKEWAENRRKIIKAAFGKTVEALKASQTKNIALPQIIKSIEILNEEIRREWGNAEELAKNQLPPVVNIKIETHSGVGSLRVEQPGEVVEGKIVDERKSLTG